MAREKFSTLTEQMFYILLCLREECCGMDVMARVNELTGGRVAVGPGTLYNLLEQFLAAGYIVETRAEGRRRSYQLTAEGETLLQNEVERLQALHLVLQQRFALRCELIAAPPPLRARLDDVPRRQKLLEQVVERPRADGHAPARQLVHARHHVHAAALLAQTQEDVKHLLGQRAEFLPRHRQPPFIDIRYS